MKRNGISFPHTAQVQQLSDPESSFRVHYTKADGPGADGWAATHKLARAGDCRNRLSIVGVHAVLLMRTVATNYPSHGGTRASGPARFAGPLRA